MNKISTTSFTITQELTAGVKSLSEQEGASLFVTLLAVFKVLLDRYSRQTDIIVGTLITGHECKEIKDLISLFDNTLAIRSNLSSQPSFREFLSRVKQCCLDACTHQNVPFERLFDIVKREQCLSSSPIFHFMFSLNDKLIKNPKPGNLSVNNIAKSERNKNSYLILSIEGYNENIIGKWKYNAELFNENTIQKMGTQ